ncbi:MAG: ATP synthase F1 subunit delta [Sulfobacillus sp.]
MSANSAADRYAQALLNGLKPAEVERYRQAMAQLSAAVKANDALARALLNPRVSDSAKLRVIAATCGEELAHLLRMFELLLAKGRSDQVVAVADAFCRLSDQLAGVVRARVEAAVALSAEQLAAISQRIGEESGQKVELEVHVNPAVVGGFRVVFSDRVWDQSLIWQLTKLRQRLEEKTPA